MNKFKKKHLYKMLGFKKIIFSFFANLKNKFGLIVKSSYYPFIIYGLLMLAFHFFIQLNTCDDITFSGVLDYKSMPDWLNERYFYWSSRLLIEFIVVIIARYQTLWRVWDTICMIVIAGCLSYILNDKNRIDINWFIVLCMCSIPMNLLSTAGWIATTTNYTWPLASGIISLIPIKNIISEKRNKWYIYLFSLFTLFYAINQELMCIFLVILLVVLLIYLIIKNRKVNKFILTQVLISLLGIIFIFTCPGNNYRLGIEVSNSFSNFGSLSFWDKIGMGYSSALYELIISNNLIFLLLAIITMLAVFIQNKKTIYKVISVIPVVTTLVLGTFYQTFASVFPYLISLRNQMTYSDIGISFSSLNGGLLILLLTIVAFSIVISIWSICKNKIEALFLIFILGLGFLTRAGMGFSPTIWVSGGRTCIFMFFSVIVVTVLLLKKIIDLVPKRKGLKHLSVIYLSLHIMLLIENLLHYLNVL